MRRKFALVGFLLGALLVGSAGALSLWTPPGGFPQFNPYRDPKWGGGVEFLGEYLYLRPCSCSADYVITDPRAFPGVASRPAFGPASLPDGQPQGISPQRGHGFRVGVAALPINGCGDVTIAFAGLWTKERGDYISPSSKSDNAGEDPLRGGIWATFGHPRLLRYRLNDSSVTGNNMQIQVATAAPRVRVMYSCIDGQAALRRIRGCDLWLRGYLGLRGATFRVRQHVTYTGTAIIPGEIVPQFQFQQHTVTAVSQTWGIGPRIGFDVRYDIAGGIGLGAHGGGSILGGWGDARWHHHFLGQPAGIVPNGASESQQWDFSKHSPFFVFPELDCRLGINYISCSGNSCSIIAEVGYEFTTFINSVVGSTFSDLAATKIVGTRNFSLDGIYVTLKVRY